MRTITLKNVPGGVHRALKTRARANARSLNREILATLEDALHSRPVDAEALARQARTVRESLGVYLTEHDLAAHKAAGRR
jgi:plasmid stability protein